MTPHLVKWQDKFEDRGFTVIDVDHGDRDTLDEVKAHIQEAEINFPVLHDTGGRVCSKYKVQGFPTAYLVGRDGTVLWGGHPFDVEELEKQIEAALDS